MATTKANNVNDALVQALMQRLSNLEEFSKVMNHLTGLVLGAAEEVRSPSADQPDAGFHDAFHCEVHNTIYAGVKDAVKLVVENWEDPSLHG